MATANRLIVLGFIMNIYCNMLSEYIVVPLWTPKNCTKANFREDLRNLVLGICGSQMESNINMSWSTMVIEGKDKNSFECEPLAEKVIT